MASIYVSSTFSDLESYRRQVLAALRRLSHLDVAMEHYGASDERPLDRCLRDVEASDLYVGIFAWKYGFVPEGQEKSITELEFRKAVETNKTCLIFLVDEDTSWPPKQIEIPALDKTHALREELGKNYLVDFFSSEHDLAAKVSQAISNWEKKIGLVKKAAQTDWDEYRYAVFEKHRWVRLQVIAGAKQERITQIPLIEIFVPQLAKKGKPTFEVPDEILQARRILFSTVKQLEVEGESPAVMAAEGSEDTQGLPAAFPEAVQEILGRERTQVILGGPGSGKSTLLHYTMLELCNPDRTSQNAPIPLLIELRQYVLKKVPDFVEYIGRNINERYGVQVDQEGIVSTLRESNRAFVFFDGLDEVFAPSERSRVIELFGTFARQYPQARVVVTSRIVGYDSADLRTEGFQHYTLLDFDVQQIRRFIPKWYEYYTWEGDERDSEGLIQRITENPRLMELAGNPLLLTMMAVIYKHQDLPEQRWKLYERCTEVLLEDWDIKRKSIGHAELFTLDINIRASQKMEILQRVSMYMLEHGQEGRELNAIAYEPLMDILAAYLEEKYNKPSGEARAIAEGILNHLRERTYILAEVGERIFGFVHRTFMEYFAACDRRAEFNAKRSDYEWLTGETFSRWQRDEWQEVLLLLIAMLSDQGSPIEDVVNYLRRNFKGGIPHNIAFAARCLAEAGAVKSESYAQDLMTELARKIAQYTKPLRKPTEEGKAEAEKFVREALTAFSMLSALFTVPPRVTAIIDDLNNSKRRGQRVAAWQMGVALRSRQERLNFAVAALSDKEEAVRLGAIAALRREWPGNDEIGQALVKVIKFDSNSRVREAAILAIKNAWSDSEEILDALGSRVDDETAYSFVISVLGYLATNWKGNLKALQLVIRLSGNKRKAGLEYDYYLVRESAVNSIVTGWGTHPDALPLLRDEILNNPDTKVRPTAILAIARVGREHPDTLPLLQDRALKDEDSDARSSAILAITEGWREHSDILPFMCNLAMNDADVEVRSSAILAISQGWYEHPSTLPLLKDRAINDPDPKGRYTAVRAILGGYYYYYYPYPRIINAPALFLQRYQHPFFSIRRTELTEMESQSHPAERAGWSRHPDTIPFLQERAVNDPDPKVRASILLGTAHWWPRDEASQNFLQVVADNDPENEVRVTAANVIQWFMSRPSDILF